jgi:hypothetical protein
MTRQKRTEPTPPSVEIRSGRDTRKPEFDPTLGIPLASKPDLPAPAHRLVTLGDSLSHGFQSGAIFNTDLSYPAIIAWELGWDGFRFPRYPGYGGLPLNLEYLLRELETVVGDKLSWWESGAALFKLRNVMDEIEDYYERGAGRQGPSSDVIHNLSVYGWDLRDHLSRTAEICNSARGKVRDELLSQVVQDHAARAAQRVLPSSPERAGETSLQAAKQLQKDGGIETLIVMLGANNALPAIVRLDVVWSKAGYDDLGKKAEFTVWDPTHFASELNLLVQQVREIGARHVIWATVPHVTVAPIARGVGKKIDPSSRYFPYYTRAWITDDEFDPNDHPHITADEARAVDSAVDQYNDAIVAAVRAARNDKLDWTVMDLAGLLDRLAQRRYLDSPAAQPDWWTPYELPPALDRLTPKPSSRFFASAHGTRTQGGLFSLDGVHPTTIAYGIVAQEFIRIMQRVGVKFVFGNGSERVGPIEVDFERLIKLDSLIASPPSALDSSLKAIGWLDDKTGIVSRLLPTAL